MLQPDLNRPVYAALPKVGAIGYASVVDIDRYAKTMTIGPHLLGVRDVALWTTDQMRAFADATHTLRTQQPALAASEWDVRGHLAASLTCWHRLTGKEADELVAMFHGLPAPADPMDWPLPCDVTVGHGTMCKGVSLRTLVARMKVLYEMATGNNADEVANRTPETRAALADAFRAKIAPTPQPAPAGATPQCPTCGTHEVAFVRECHNSACREYGTSVTIYEGWKNPTPQPSPWDPQHTTAHGRTVPPPPFPTAPPRSTPLEEADLKTAAKLEMADEYQRWIDHFHKGGDYDGFLRIELAAKERGV